ncbi:LysR family transcriptional regulator [Mesorhizobium sp. ArgA1]
MFDLDHFRTQVRKMLSSERSGSILLDRKDAKPIQYISRHHPPRQSATTYSGTLAAPLMPNKRNVWTVTFHLVMPSRMRNRLDLRPREMANLKLRQLDLIVAVEEAGSLGKAASRIGMTQPAVSKSLHELENMLGQRIFDRLSRGVAPTPAGEIVLRHAKIMLRQLRHATEELSMQLTGQVGEVHVGSLLAATPFLLPRSIGIARELYPGLRIKVTEGTSAQLLNRLSLGEVDIVLGRVPDIWGSGNIRTEPIYMEPISFVARVQHPLATLHDIGFADLVGFDWILPALGTVMRSQVEAAFRHAQVPSPERFLEGLPLLSQLALLASTDMIGVLPQRVILTQPGISPLRMGCSLPDIAVGYSLRGDVDPSPATSAYVQALKLIVA